MTLSFVNYSTEKDIIYYYEKYGPDGSSEVRDDLKTFYKNLILYSHRAKGDDGNSTVQTMRCNLFSCDELVLL